MSHVAFICDQQQCFRGGSHVGECQDCDLLAFSERVADVYRPHRRAVMQAQAHTMDIRNTWRAPLVYLKARLGCPEARAWLRRKRRLESGTFLTRWSWSWLPRGHVHPHGAIPLGRQNLMTGRERCLPTG